MAAQRCKSVSPAATLLMVCQESSPRPIKGSRSNTNASGNGLSDVACCVLLVLRLGVREAETEEAIVSYAPNDIFLFFHL